MSGDRAERIHDNGHGDTVTSAKESPPRQGSMSGVLRSLAIALMLACIAISLAQFIARLWSAYPVMMTGVLVFLIALESVHAHRLLVRHEVNREDRFRFRFVEWVIILLLARFGPYVYLGGERLAQDMARWNADILTFLGVEFLALATFMGAFWGTALLLARSIDELEASPLEHRVSVRDPEYYLRATMPQHGQVNRQEVLDRIITVFYVGGAVLLIFAGLARVDVADVVLLRATPSSGVILNALIYFVLGFLLISQAQYTIYHARWQIQGVPILDEIGRRWFIAAVSFLGLVALMAALLPAGYSVGIINTLSTLFGWVFFALAQLAFGLIFLFSLLINFIYGLFGLELEAGTPQMDRVVTPPPAPDPISGAGWPWLALLRSVLFWGVLLAIIIYSVFFFARDRWGILAGFSLRHWLTILKNLWQGLRKSGQHAWRGLTYAIRERIQGSRPMAAGWSGWRPNLRRLSPQERVRYFYLSILHRTAREGPVRSPAATPNEYRDPLAAALSDRDEEVALLTEAFNDARYSAHEVTGERASFVGQAWRSLRRALVLRRRAEGSQKSERDG